MINAGGLVLKRWEPAWAAALVEVVRASLPELNRFMPWAHQGYGVEDADAFLTTSASDWERGTAFNYAVFTAIGELVGAASLMTRMGPGVLEIGYWIHSAHTGQGYATAAARTLASLARSLPGVDRVALRHDAANAGSAAVAGKAGFVEVDRFARSVEAPGESGVAVLREWR
ncbi:Protein N-acetyltransferase, RimJ/RimL family [Micromonospora pattaloongensis]|uniref:Protein N-acetyltransferase, RimJ/RimL family n=2 Tax=Micromonospora pattaloongensis TaxID=405436 RepID=A0A1H3JGY5_9ACTN|nr:Protein N-acetyltransferase, RimJ/RimL family [Micromonospora pattaloongensis]